MLIAGVDEAGRGPLAGPVVAAAVILDEHSPIKGLADSKTLTELRRVNLASQGINQNEISGLAFAPGGLLWVVDFLGAQIVSLTPSGVQTWLPLPARSLPR